MSKIKTFLNLPKRNNLIVLVLFSFLGFILIRHMPFEFYIWLLNFKTGYLFNLSQFLFPFTLIIFCLFWVILINLICNLIFVSSLTRTISLNSKFQFVSVKFSYYTIFRVIYIFIFLFLVFNIEIYKLESFKFAILNNFKTIDNKIYEALKNYHSIDEFYLQFYYLAAYIIIEIILEYLFKFRNVIYPFNSIKNFILLLKFKIFRWSNIYLIFAINSLILLNNFYSMTMDNFYKIYTVSEVTVKNLSSYSVAFGEIKYIQASVDSRYKSQSDCLTDYIVPKLKPNQSIKFVFKQNMFPKFDVGVIEELAVNIKFDNNKKLDKIFKFPFLYDMYLINLSSFYNTFKKYKNYYVIIDDKSDIDDISSKSYDYFTRIRYWKDRFDTAILRYYLNNIQNQNCYNKELVIYDDKISIKPVP